jgi:hypothetical protein
MLSFTDKELRKSAEADAAADPKAENHVCRVATNYAGTDNGTVETCQCGQKWRMKSGFFFSKWQRI